MYKGSLCEKLANTFSIESDSERISLSIKNHIHNILNTHKGSVRSNPDYGVDLTGDCRLNQYDLAENIAFDIENQLLKYDPRIREVRVKYTGESLLNPEKMRFYISGIACIENKVLEFNTNLIC